MDPLSIFGAAFTALQILNELIELAQKLDESLEKVKKNMKATKQVSFQILDNLTQIKAFYDQHREVLEDAKEFRFALVGLKTELEIAYKRCNALFVAPSRTRIGKSKAAFNAWFNRGKVEAEIAEIKAHVQECHIRFTTMAAFRIQANTEILIKTASRLEKANKDIGKGVLKLSDQQQRGLRDIQASLISHGLTSQPPVVPQTTTVAATSTLSASDRVAEISEQVVSQMFVRHKIDHIDKSLTRVSHSETVAVHDPTIEYTRPFQSIIALNPAIMDQRTRYDEVVQKILNIMRILQDPNRTVSIQEGAWDMVNLAIQLFNLEMYPEAVTIGRWTVDLFRTLSQSRPDIYLPYLGLTLLNLSSYLSKVGDIAKATSTIVECIQLNREMQSTYETKELRNQLGRALLVSSDIAHKANDVKRASEDAEEAVHLFEMILDELDDWEALFSPLVLTEEPSPFNSENNTPNPMETDDDLNTLASATLVHDGTTSFNDRIMDNKHKFVLDYASALHRLSFCFEAQELPEQSYNAEKRAFIEIRKIHSIYPGNFLHILGEASYRLCLHMFREWVTEEEALEYAQEATKCYHLLVQQSPTNAIEYYNTLWEHGTLLGALGRNDEAFAIWKEMVDFSKQTIKDQSYIADACRQISWSLRRLNRFEEAVTFRSESVKGYRIAFQTTTKYEADGQHDLANELFLSRRLEEAVEAQQEAVGHYRTLAMQDPATYSKKLANALTQLCNYLVAVREYDQALEEGTSALDLFKDMELTPEVATAYLYCLRVMINAAFESDDEARSLKDSHACATLFQHIYDQYPDLAREGLANAYATHGFKLTKHNKTKEALKWSEDSLRWFEKQPLEGALVVVDIYLATLINLGDEVSHIGQPRKALRYIEQAIEVGRKYCLDHEPSYPVNACALLNRGDMLLDLGQYEAAESAAREAVEYAKAHPAEDVTQLSGTLSVHATALARVGRLEEAVTVGLEAVEVCRSASAEVLARTPDMFAPLQIPRSLRALADVYADARDPVKALECAQKAYQEVEKVKGSSLSWSFVEVPHSACRMTYATMLLLGGRAEEAVTHLEALSELYITRLAVKPGYHVRYAGVLLVKAWCYCALGEHDKGVQAAEELKKMRNSLRVAFREVSELTEVELKKEGTRPAGQAIWNRLNLSCGHQSLLPPR